MTATVITTFINGQKRYVTGLSNRWDNKKLAGYSPEAAMAKTFDDAEAARGIISKLHNPHDRVFTVEEIPWCYEWDNRPILVPAQESLK